MISRSGLRRDLSRFFSNSGSSSITEPSPKNPVKHEKMSPQLKEKLSSVKRSIQFESEADEVIYDPSSGSSEDKYKKSNTTQHSPYTYSPLKPFPSDDKEPTMSDLMNVLQEHGRKMATKQDLRDSKKISCTIPNSRYLRPSIRLKMN